jgi:hypothetical protein
MPILLLVLAISSKTAEKRRCLWVSRRLKETPFRGPKAVPASIIEENAYFNAFFIAHSHYYTVSRDGMIWFTVSTVAETSATATLLLPAVLLQVDPSLRTTLSFYLCMSLHLYLFAATDLIIWIYSYGSGKLMGVPGPLSELLVQALAKAVIWS